MSPVAGWYSDPAEPARLRWWDGSTWTDDTRPSTPRTAPPPPGTSGDPTAGPASGTTAGPGAGPAPGSSGGWETPGSWGASGSWDTRAGAAAGTGSPGAGAPRGPGTSTSAGFGYGYGPTTTAAGARAAGSGEPRRAWLSWASIGAAVAVASAVIIILSVSLLGHTTKVPASQGLSTTPTSGDTSTTSTAPPTSVAPPPPDSTVFQDPAGAYSISINTAWEVPATTTNGIALWYLTGVNYGGFRANLDIVSQTLPGAEPLTAYVQANVNQMSRLSGVHVGPTTDITLDDGTAATVIPYSTTVVGQSVQGEAIVTVHGTHAVTVTVLASGDAAATTFNLADPYVRSLHLN